MDFTWVLIYLASLVLAFLYYIVDVKQHKSHTAGQGMAQNESDE